MELEATSVPDLVEPLAEMVGGLLRRDFCQGVDDLVEFFKGADADEGELPALPLDADGVTGVTGVEAVAQPCVEGVPIGRGPPCAGMVEEELRAVCARRDAFAVPAAAADGEAVVGDFEGHRAQVRCLPPSMGRVAPVIQPVASERSQTMASATSSAWPTRPMGWVCWLRSRKAA